MTQAQHPVDEFIDQLPAAGRANPKTVPKETAIYIPAPNTLSVSLEIEGTAPLVMHKFSAKSKTQIIKTQEAGSAGKGRKIREPRDFNADFEGAKHLSMEGWIGIPCNAVKAAMVRACSLCGVKMTVAKVSFWVEPDGFDSDEGVGLIRITKGEPKKHTGYVRNETGVVDIRCRPMWDVGWRATVRINFDANNLKPEHVANLLAIAGHQVGILEGRPGSKEGVGMGWGTFRIRSTDEKNKDCGKEINE